MKTKTPILALLLAAGCGSPGERPACTADADCAPGTTCQQTTEGGVCWPANTLSLDAPAANALVGSGGVPATATLVLGKAGSTAPATVELQAGAASAGTLAKVSQAGTSAAYAGTYLPAPGTNGSVALAVRATVALAQGTEQVASPAVTVRVDTAPPAFGTVSAACAGECKRDGVLAVAAQVTDANAVTASVSLSLAPADARAMTLSAGSYRVDVALKDLPFPYFSQTVTATLKATDAAGNEATHPVDVLVTRLRWATPAEPASPPQLTGAAIDPAGRIIVGGSNSRLYFYDPSGAPPTSISVGSIGITAAPSVGPTAIWVGSEDGRLYAVKPDGSGVLIFCPAGPLSAAPLYTPALTTAALESAYSAGGNKRIYAAKSDASVCTTPGTVTTDAVTTALTISGNREIGVTATAIAAASVRSFTDPGDGALSQDWVAAPTNGATACTQIDAPLAADASGQILAACGNGQLYRLDKSTGAFEYLVTLAGKATESVVVRSDGDLVLGTNDNLLHRLTTTAVPPGLVEKWGSLPDLQAAVTGVLLGARDGIGVDTYAVTAGGGLYAVDADATASGLPAARIVWSTATEPTPPLGLAKLGFPTIAPAQANGLPTLYAGSADGKLYAVVVDSGLDTTAPWPKSHHDTRNTGNAAAPLP
jgi:hypothetical protein